MIWRPVLALYLALMLGESHAIVGGGNAMQGEQPWMAAMLYTSEEPDPECIASGGSAVFCQQVCGASLISANWAVTAAHCLINRTNPAFIKLAIGNTDLNGEGISLVGVSAFYAVDGVPGPSNIYQDDLALLLLESPQAGPFASLSSVADAADLLAIPDSDDRLEIFGWGQLDTGEFPSQLQRVRVDLDQGKCGGLFVGVSMLCSWEATPQIIELDDAGDSTPLDQTGEDACILDSGGPVLFINDARERLLAGVVSWGVDSNCGASSFGTAHTRIDHFLEWIETASTSAGQPMADLATEIVAAKATGSGSESVRIFLRNQSILTPIDNPRLEIRFDGVGSLGTPAGSGMSCSVVAGGYDCTPTLLPMAAGAAYYVDLTASALQPDSSIHIEAHAIPGGGEQDYRDINSSRHHLLSRTEQADLLLESLGTIAWFDEQETSLWLQYRAGNLSDSVVATAPEISFLLAPQWNLEFSDGATCISAAVWTCTLSDLSAGEDRIIRLEFRRGPAESFQVSAAMTSVSGDFPSVLDGEPDAVAVSDVSFPERPIGGGSSGGGSNNALLLLALGSLMFRSRLRGRWFPRPA
jgi:secreted trypsin-like serine protease